MRRIVFCGGGTAGHVMPNIALIEVLKNQYEIFYIGSESGVEKNLISEYPYVKYFSVQTTKLKRSLSLDNLLIPFKLIKGINQAKKILKDINPDIIFSKGGFVSVPTCLAGKSLKIPIICHESDLSLGLANKIISKTAKHTCCSFKPTVDRVKNGVYTGTPIRNNLLNGNRQKIVKQLDLDEKKPTLLVVGGSLGAKAINNVIYECAKDLSKIFNIIHIVGKGNKCNLEFKNYSQFEFVDNMGDIYAASDIIVSRAGSNAINEMLVLNKPMILIPLPKTQSRGDQLENAEYFKSKNYCEVIFQEDLSPILLKSKIKETYKNKDFFINNMNKNKSENAVQIICQLINKI